MRTTPPIGVAALVLKPACRERIRAALGDYAAVHFAQTIAELVQTIARTDLDLVLVEPWGPDRTPMRDTVSSLRREFPSISIAVYTDCSPAAVRELLELSKVGVDEVLIRNVDDARTSLRNVVSAAKRRRTDDAVLEVLTARTSEHVRPILEYILRRANRPITVEEVARGLGVHRKTLLNRLSAVGSPCPSALVSWCRLIAASRLLQDPGRSVEQVAQLVGFGSASALRNMLRRHAGMAPSEVRARGYCSDLVDALVCQRSARPTADVAP